MLIKLIKPLSVTRSLLNGSTDFYFSAKEDRGYINRLDFRVDGEIAKTEDHPSNIDIIKLVLPKTLGPGQSIQITTPFHEKLPLNFSRGGHTAQSYQITQWYPKPAVYDFQGWHPMPYLQSGEFYSEFGSFDVQITVPDNYVVAATGELQNDDEKKWLLQRAHFSTPTPLATQKTTHSNTHSKSASTGSKTKSKSSSKSKTPPPQPVEHKSANKPITIAAIPTSTTTKTLQFRQDRIHDFAWFADKNYIVNHDTLRLASGRVIDIYTYYFPKDQAVWNKSVAFLKDAIQFRSLQLGEYPYNVVSGVEAKMGFSGGMEYPTITSISPVRSAKSLDITLEHEAGHNWFYGILANNERRYPWMDEGINSFYDNRYKAWKYPSGESDGWMEKRVPEDQAKPILQTFEKLKWDQPVNTPSDSLNKFNYFLMSYEKTALWLKQVEDSVGQTGFDSAMRIYFRDYQFKHVHTPLTCRLRWKQPAAKNLSAEI